MRPSDREIPALGFAAARRAPSATTGVGSEVVGIRRIELPVAGLTCPACVQTVERALRAVPGVARAVVNLAQARAFVEYDPDQATVSALHDAIKAAGYRSEGAKARFKIEGITCALHRQDRDRAPADPGRPLGDREPGRRGGGGRTWW